MRFAHALLTVGLLVLGACASAPSAIADASAPTFVVVRHAEKGQDDPRDPSLNESGRVRAQALAKALSDAPLIAVYATAYKRTQQTALPAAMAHRLQLTTYDAAQEPDDFAAALRRDHTRGTILIVGHSNTVPQIVAALCACTVAALGDDDYGNFYWVGIDTDGNATLQQRRY